jgi:NADPH-dependent 2,4-dienoyl-CoA reductase/sulfur reductase-like enzyme/rhodanese-related sulfurtransferase
MSTNMSQSKRIVIVGGVAGGAASAGRARRLSEAASIVLFERGREISFANCGMPYYIGGAIRHRDRLLVQTPEGMRKRYRVDVRTRVEVASIDRAAKTVTARDLASGRESIEPYDVLILSPGAAPLRPPIAGLDSPKVFTLRGLADMDAIRESAVAASAGGGSALVLGGGYIGLEMAEALRSLGLGVTLVELTGQVFAPVDPEMAEPLHQHLLAHGVDLQLGVSLAGARETTAGLQATLSNGRRIECSFMVLAAGIRPEAALAREAGLAIGPTGGIVVDEHMRTSDPDIFAIGDVAETADLVIGKQVIMPLAGLANRQGRIAADNAFGRPSVYRKSLGTAICKVFDLAVACVGPNERTLRRLARPYEKIYVHPASHAGYYPGASTISVKLLFDPAGGKVLGAQAIGAEGIDKRIDVLAVAIRAGLTVFDLEELELAYAPPYGSARDAVNYAGSAAANVIRGDVGICHAEEAARPSGGQTLLDVRTAEEVRAGTIPGAINIPIDELRGRLDELPRDKEVLAFCRVGLRGHLACRVLSQNGFRCRNLSGGWLTYQAATKHLPPPPPAPREVHQDSGEADESLPEAEGT